MVKSKELSWNAQKSQNILTLKVQNSHCSKFNDFRPAKVRFLKHNILSVEQKIELETMPH
jgi:hypothetical protein